MTADDASGAPGACYGDTSVLSAALMVGTAHHTASLAFLQALAQQRIPVYFSTLARLEMLEATRRVGAEPKELDITLRDRFQLRRWHEREAVRVAWSDYVQTALERLLQQFAEAHERRITSDIIGRASAVMNRFRIRSYDALHVATAEEAGVTRFAAVDGDFARVRGFEIVLVRD